MNDKSELVHGLDCAKKAIRFMQPSPLFSDWSQDFTDAIDRIKERDINDIFTVSFCRNPDLLSQWRVMEKHRAYRWCLIRPCW
jgi:hypothetical protein